MLADGVVFSLYTYTLILNPKPSASPITQMQHGDKSSENNDSGLRKAAVK